MLRHVAQVVYRATFRPVFARLHVQAVGHMTAVLVCAPVVPILVFVALKAIIVTIIIMVIRTVAPVIHIIIIHALVV